MPRHLTHRHTLWASYIAYITQAIVNNLYPLLFVTFNTKLNISLEKLGLLVSYNFVIQILVDFLAAKYILKLGFRVGVVAAHVLASTGMVLLGILPNTMADPFAGLIIAITCSAMGGGLLEVLVSPIVESLPTEEKSSSMSLLHAFYCWGHMAVVLLSTLYFNVAGIESWHWVAILWAAVPFANIFFFAKVPLCVLPGDEHPANFSKLFSARIFWLFVVLMLCAGASELAMAQWSSMFAEAGLNISKTMGDLLGPCAFALTMGIGRTAYGIFGTKLNIRTALLSSAVLCIISYLVAIFAQNPIISLIGCAATGLGVALMWPGTYSLAAKHYPTGGTAMFALLALAGDLGCSTGPGLVGWVAGAAVHVQTDLLSVFGSNGSLKLGLLCAIIFPLIMLIALPFLKRRHS